MVSFEGSSINRTVRPFIPRGPVSSSLHFEPGRPGKKGGVNVARRDDCALDQGRECMAFTCDDLENCFGRNSRSRTMHRR
jgi:hypothetical protein